MSKFKIWSNFAPENTFWHVIRIRLIWCGQKLAQWSNLTLGISASHREVQGQIFLKNRREQHTCSLYSMVIWSHNNSCVPNEANFVSLRALMYMTLSRVHILLAPNGQLYELWSKICFLNSKSVCLFNTKSHLDICVVSIHCVLHLNFHVSVWNRGADVIEGLTS